MTENEKKTEVVDIRDIIPDDHNFNKGTEKGREMIEKSFRELGAGRSILLDKNNRIIAGNKSQQAAIATGITKVRIVDTEGDEIVAVRRRDVDLDSKVGRELAFADNATQQVSLAWDEAELQQAAQDYGLDIDEWGVELPELADAQDMGTSTFETDEEQIERKRKEFEEKMQRGELDDDDQEYQEFLKKFEAKKTTDDCYTPAPIYEAVAQWVAREYNVNHANFVRPFYPGGDYQREQYKPEDIVVDNPPFSILSKILNFYRERGIRFFLFAPALTLFSSSSSSSCTAICAQVTITYENNASVCTSFLTNLDDPDIRLRTAPDLYALIKKADDENRATQRVEIPKYEYPDNIVTSSMAGLLCNHGIRFTVRVSESELCSQLDSQRESGKTIFGKGYLISDAKGAELKEARRQAEEARKKEWKLSDREREIVERLNHAHLTLNPEPKTE